MRAEIEPGVAERYTLKYGPFWFVREADVLKPNFAVEGRHRYGVFSVRYFRVDVENVEHTAQSHRHILSRHPIT